MLHTDRTAKAADLVAHLKAENLRLQVEVDKVKEKMTSMLKKADDQDNQYAALTLHCSTLEKDKKKLQDQVSELSESVEEAEMIGFSKGQDISNEGASRKEGSLVSRSRG